MKSHHEKENGMTHITNYGIAWDAARYIIAHPDQHGQRRWISACGTYRCYAGWIVYLAGWENVVDPMDGAATDMVRKGDLRRTIPHAACDELGIAYVSPQFWRLFHSDNTLFAILDALFEFATADGIEVPGDILAARAVALAADHAAEVAAG